MDPTQHQPGNDEFFAAVDFGEQPGHDSGAILDFVDESEHDSAEQSVVEAWDTDEPAEHADTVTETELAAIDTPSEDTEDTDADDEIAWQLATVTNPAETVSVTAIMDGTVHNIELSADTESMTESELADEILVIADLARRQALSTQHTLMLESFQALGANDDEAVSDFLENVMGLSSPAQAAEAQAGVFTTRYASDHG